MPRAIRALIFLVLAVPCLAREVHTKFDTTENPLRQNSLWVDGQDAGGNLWGNVQTNGTKAFGVTQPTSYGDPTALVSGTWGPDQDVTVKINRTSNPGFAETEIRLRSMIGVKRGTCSGTQCNSGYEVLCSDSAYIQVVKWHGPNGAEGIGWDYLGKKNGTSCNNGDVLREKVTGGAGNTVINVWLNGAPLTFDTGVNVADSNSPYVDGQPGIGFCCSTTAFSASGISEFYATDGLGLSSGILAPDRAADWTYAGVPGGIPSGSWANCTTSACNTLWNNGVGTQVTASNIVAALTSAANNTAVRIPPTSGCVDLGVNNTYTNRSNVVLRGAGPTNTCLLLGTNKNIFIGASGTSGQGGYPNGPYYAVNWTGGLAKGSSYLTVASTTNIAVGQTVILDQHNDSYVFTTGSECCQGAGRSEVPDFNPPNPGVRTQFQMTVVTAVNDATHITVDPPVDFNATLSLVPQVFWWNPNGTPKGNIQYVGVENLKIDANLQDRAIAFAYCSYCWVKNVEVKNARRGGIFAFYAYRSEFRDSYISRPGGSDGPQQYGLEIFNSSYLKLENNILYNETDQVQISSSDGVVVGYNYTLNNNTGAQYQAIEPHQVHNFNHLYEGNATYGFNYDNVWGSASHMTSFRNYSSGYAPNKNSYRTPMTIAAHNRYVNLVGNVFGTPGYHTRYQVDNSNANGSDNFIYQAGFWNGYGNGTANYDSTALTSLMRWGNWDSVTYAANGNTNGIRWCTASGAGNPACTASETASTEPLFPGLAAPSQTLPASMYLASKPTWFGNVAWPAIGPDVSCGSNCVANTASHAAKIPAQLGYENGTKDGNGYLTAFDANTFYYGATSPAVTLNPTSLTFSLQGIGTSSASQPVTLTNSGTDILSISSIAASGDYSQTNNCGTSLGAGLACAINVTFTPTAAGTRTGTLTITDNAAGSPHTVSLTGTAAPVLTLSPTSLTFASQAVGTSSSSQAVTIQNTGGSAVTISSVSTSGDFSQTNNCGTLNAGASCTANVTFTPTVAGSRSGVLTAIASGQSFTASLSGTGVTPAPVASLSPNPLVFGPQTVGTTSAPLTATLTNTGTATLTLGSIIFQSGPEFNFGAGGTCLTVFTTLTPGQSCTKLFTYTPDHAGTATPGAVNFFSNDANSPAVLNLTGTGIGIIPNAVLSATSLSFTSQVVGTTSSAQSVTLSNTGTATLNIASIVISGNFAQTNTCGSSVAAGNSCSISITFTPTQTGVRSGGLTITDNAGNIAGSTQTVSLSGNGIAAASSTIFGRASASASTISGRLSPSEISYAQPPQEWVASGVAGGANADTGFAPSATFDAVKTMKASGGDYTPSFANLIQAKIDQSNANQNWLLVIDAGTTITCSSWDGNNNCFTWPSTDPSVTKSLVVRSSSHNTEGQSVCSDVYPTVRDKNCVSDASKFWKIAINALPTTGRGGMGFKGAHHIVVEDVEIYPAPGASQSLNQVKVPIQVDMDGGNYVGLAYSYIHGWNPGDPGQPAGTCTWFNKSAVVNTSGTTVTWVSGERFGMEISDGSHSVGWNQATVTINGTGYLVSNHDPAVSDQTFTIATSAGTQTGVTMTWSNPRIGYSPGCGDDSRGIQASCTNCFVMYNYINKIHWDNNESHAISLGFSAGPVKIVGNNIEPGTCGIFVGGGPVDTRGGPAHNVEARGNIINRDLELRFISAGAGNSPKPPFGVGPLDGTASHTTSTLRWVTKNDIELKECLNCLFSGNIVSGNWSDGQSGYAIVLNPRTASGGQNAGIYDPVTGRPSTAIRNIRLENIWINNTPQGVELSTRSLSAGNGGGLSRWEGNVDFVNFLWTNVGDNNQFGSPGADLFQWSASGQTFLAGMSRTGGFARAQLQPMNLASYNYQTGAMKNVGTFNTAFIISSVVRSGGVVTVKMSANRQDPEVGGSWTISNTPGWNGSFIISGVSIGGSSTACTTDNDGNTVLASIATQPQPGGGADGTFGEEFSYADAQGSDGTLCSSASTCNALNGGAGIFALLDTLAFKMSDIELGDGVYVHNCTGGNAPTSYQAGSNAYNPATTGTDPTGLDVYYANPGGDDNSGTVCQVENSQGLPRNMTVRNMTVLASKIMSISSNGLKGQHYKNRITKNIFAMPAGNNAVLTDSDIGGQGSAQFASYDGGTFAFFGNVLQGRTLSQWSVIPVGSAANAFPSTVECNGISTTNCIGLQGWMSGVAFPFGPATYDGLNPNNAPLMAAPWSTNFDLSRIRFASDSFYRGQGFDVDAFINAINSKQYQCPPGLTCGTGPKPD